MSKEDIEQEPLEESEPEIIQKPKRTLNHNQREAIKINLAKGRAIRDAKRAVKLNEDRIVAEEMILKKAEKLIKAKETKTNNIKKMIGIDDDDVEIEERIIKKPKKKKIIYREESDSEEEIIIKRKEKELPAKEQEITKKELPSAKPSFSIKFV